MCFNILFHVPGIYLTTSTRVTNEKEFGRTIEKACRSQYPLGLRHELSSLARTLGSWVRIPLKEWMSVLCAFILCSAVWR
jgi:hypothetical protein